MGSVCVCTHADIQLVQQHLLMLPFSHCVTLAFFIKKKNQVLIDVQIYVWVSNLISLIKCIFLFQYHAVFNTLAQYYLKSGMVISPEDFFFIFNQDSFNYTGFLFILHEVEYYSSKV